MTATLLSPFQNPSSINKFPTRTFSKRDQNGIDREADHLASNGKINNKTINKQFSSVNSSNHETTIGQTDLHDQEREESVIKIKKRGGDTACSNSRPVNTITTDSSIIGKVNTAATAATSPTFSASSVTPGSNCNSHSKLRDLSGSTVFLGLGIRGRRPSNNLLEMLDSSDISTDSITIKNSNTIATTTATTTAATAPMNSNDTDHMRMPTRDKQKAHPRPMSHDSIATTTTELFDTISNSSSASSSNYELSNSITNSTTNNNMNDFGLNPKPISLSNLSPNLLNSSNSLLNQHDMKTPLSNFIQLGFKQSASSSSSPSPSPSSIVYNNNKQNNLRSQSNTPPHPASLNKSQLVVNLPLSRSVVLSNGSRALLTPSQRLRLRRELNDTALRNSVKGKEKFFDQFDDDVLQDDGIDKTQVWNIPMASFSTSSFLSTSSTQSSSKHNKRPNTPRIKNNSNSTHSHNNSSQLYNPSIHSQSSNNILHSNDNNSINSNSNHSNHSSSSSTVTAATNTSQIPLHFNIPASPIPGLDNVSDFQYLEKTTQDLSCAYIKSSTNLSRAMLSNRSSNASLLPLEIKEASDNGMEDLLLVSDDKLNSLSFSRPSWLPPKDPREKKLHETNISDKLQTASQDHLKKQKIRSIRHKKNIENHSKYNSLFERGLTRNSSLYVLKRLIWETSLLKENRLKFYPTLLESEKNLISLNFIETFESLSQLRQNIEFPKIKEEEINQSIELVINKSLETKQILRDLNILLQLKSISQQGLMTGDVLLFYHLLKDSNQEQHYLQNIWTIVNLIQMTCFSETCKQNYDANIFNSNSVMSSYLSNKPDFKKEFNPDCINFNTWWNILRHVDHKLFMWILDIIVINNGQCFKNLPAYNYPSNFTKWEQYKSSNVFSNHKILLSLTLTVLLNYHFGFDDLKTLYNIKNSTFHIPLPLSNDPTSEETKASIDATYSFVNKWLHYFKKF
ncbi:hypothetical protein TBLA_0A03580 [Henningerozyma blattae CBS 6284]|uniref:Protein SBE22 n=1 Tax=Henningerozyma blattae (strain ATCC 34711 / CBS 6284 / DSM 70876 / NBRC 10599 / NRRL Y-10934 / UCD 77-7) TaxID=1071380 RepID=I2GVK5_HENB6|nr:hypothetical protein TBLA_0A03580 [Tetrapisispora blattae CBS 6284]CCH58157.1 hypothetical protein TBLA_0A03580 [Tetrapisispora blattae CBS 6284]